MKSESEKHRLWYESVVQPKLQTLRDLSQAEIDLSTFEHKKFFKEFLADLEMLALDNYKTENMVEKISAAIEVLKKNNFNGQDISLKDLALIAFCKNAFDRLLFYGKWKKYQKFVKENGPVPDEVLVDAYRLSNLLNTFIDSINLRAQELISESEKSAS